VWQKEAPSVPTAFGASCHAYLETGLCTGVVDVICHPQESHWGTNWGHSPSVHVGSGDFPCRHRGVRVCSRRFA
jgi:hypothetical protein